MAEIKTFIFLVTDDTYTTSRDRENNPEISKPYKTRCGNLKRG